ncbi:MAG: Fe-S cluster assembly protein SufD [Rhodothermales bacterium]|jgi:Fe-S cluster assembly protein SufD
MTTTSNILSDFAWPHLKEEDWRFTPLQGLKTSSFQPAAEGADPGDLLSQFGIPDADGARLVFVDGHFRPALSTLLDLPCELRNFGDDLPAELGRLAADSANPFTRLNATHASDGIILRIPRGSVIETPIHLVFLTVTPDAFVAPRILVIAESASAGTLIESHAGPDGLSYLSCPVVELQLADAANIDHIKLQREGNQATHIADTHVDLQRDCVFSSHSIALGGQLARNDVSAILAAEGITCTLNGLFLSSDKQVSVNHTALDHAMPNCNSFQIYKGILDDRARGVFNGRILVREDAQKTSAEQTNRALLLSDDARVDSKPQLEIFADDVRCTHGATIGQLDPQALFYLRARGIDRKTARGMLTYAFADDAVADIRVAPVLAEVEAILMSRFG